MKVFVNRYPVLFYIAGAGLIGFAVFTFVTGVSSSLGGVHTLLLERVHARGWTGSNISLYVKCLMIDSSCGDWYWSQMEPLPYTYLYYLLGGGMVVALPLGLRSKQKPYSASFAEVEELADIRHKSWTAEGLHYALLIGFHVPLPEEEPLRSKVIRGHSFAGLDKGILALPKGYGDRSELGHLAAFGATRSGKSLHLMTQAVTWRGSLITLDIKGELYSQTAGLRAETGRVFCLSPEGEGHRFDAIGEILKSRNGDLTAGLIICEPQKSSRPEFAERAAKGLAAIFGAAVRLGVPPLEFAREIVIDGGITTFITRVAEFDDPEVRERASGFMGMGNDSQMKLEDKIVLAHQNKYLTSSWDVMSSKLTAFASTAVSWTFSGNDFTPADLMRQSASVYLMFQEATLEATSPIYNMLVSGLIVGMTRYVDESRKVYGARWSPPVPVLVGLDEVKRAPIANLDAILSTAAGRNISVMLYLQSPSQFDDLYGKDATESILNNCGVQLYYKTESVGTAEYIQKRCHKFSVVTRSVSRTINRWFRPVSRSESTTPRELFTVEEALALGGEKRKVILAFVSGKRPFLVKRMAYFEHKIGKLMGLYRAPPVPVMGELPLRAPIHKPKLVLPNLATERRDDEEQGGEEEAHDMIVV